MVTVGCSLIHKKFLLSVWQAKINLIFQILLIFLFSKVCDVLNTMVKLLLHLQNNTFNVDNDDLLSSVDCIDQMVLDMRVKDEISPSLRTIVNQFDESNRRPTDIQLQGPSSAEDLDNADNNENGFDREEYENCTAWSDDHDDQTVVADLDYNDADPSFSSYPQVFLFFNHRNIYDFLE